MKYIAEIPRATEMSPLKLTTVTTKETRARNHQKNSLGGLLAELFQLFPHPLDVPVDAFEGWQ